MSNISRFRNPGECYREVQRIQKQISIMHNKVFIEKVGLDTAERMALLALSQDPLVTSDWTMLSQVEDMVQTHDAGKLLTTSERLS